MTEAAGQLGARLVALNHADRDVFDRALATARVNAFAPREFVGQESFMPASDILRLAERAGVGPGTSVIDVCCGVGGPGLLVASRLGCRYHGVDASAAAVRIARARARDLNGRFDVSQIPPLPAGHYDVVMLLETMLAFRDKPSLLRHVRDALPLGGRFVFTLEEGRPLNTAERSVMPDPDTVWLLPLPEIRVHLRAAGLRVQSQTDCTGRHQAVAQRLHDEFLADASNIAAHIGADALGSLLAAHQLWAEWLGNGRVRKFAFVAEKVAA